MGVSKGAVRVWAEAQLSGAQAAPTELELVSFQCAYELNRIPTATAVLPVGRDVRNLAQLAPTHALLRDTRYYIPVKVYLEVAHEYSNTTAIVSDGKRLIFEGYITNFGYQKTNRGMAPTIEMLHWLSDLNFASILSETSHPSSPADFTFQASVSKQEAITTGGATTQHAFYYTSAQKNFAANEAEKDLWGKGIYPWLKELAETNRQYFTAAPTLSPTTPTNARALAALARVTSPGLPLLLPPNSQHIALRAIARDIAVRAGDPQSGSNHFQAIANTTLWDKLVGDLGPTYLFALAPRPEDALIVPFTPGLRTVWAPDVAEPVTISDRDLDNMQMIASASRLLRGAIVYGHAASFQSGVQNLVEVPQGTLLGGVFEAAPEGMWLFYAAPRWASELLVLQPATSRTILSGYATALDPDADSGVGLPTVGAAFAASETLLNRIARWLYLHDVLKNRTGQLAGPLRFDICPGSTISFEGQPGAFLPEVPSLGEGVNYAAVLRVGYNIDAEAGLAGTTFLLSHIRSNQENLEDATSVTQHPLYAQTWSGDRLTPS